MVRGIRSRITDARDPTPPFDTFLNHLLIDRRARQIEHVQAVSLYEGLDRQPVVNEQIVPFIMFLGKKWIDRFFSNLDKVALA